MSLIIPEVLGYGHSERNTEPGDRYTIKSYADSLAKILDELGVAQVDLVGHPYGGATAARFALDYPTACAAWPSSHPRSTTNAVRPITSSNGRSVSDVR